MDLDTQGVHTHCAGCGTTNRLRYAELDRETRCGKCRTALPHPSTPIEVASTAVFDAAVASSSVPILVDFWAAWCGPCRMVAPEVHKAAQRLAGRALVLKVDTDANPELSQRFGIRSIPTIAVFGAGREVSRVAGVQRAEAMEAMVERLATVRT
jgi:thioredoxin 2